MHTTVLTDVNAQRPLFAVGTFYILVLRSKYEWGRVMHRAFKLYTERNDTMV